MEKINRFICAPCHAECSNSSIEVSCFNFSVVMSRKTENVCDQEVITGTGYGLKSLQRVNCVGFNLISELK